MDSRRWPWVWVALTAVLGWGSTLLGILSLLAVPAFILTLAWLFRRRRWRPAIVLLVTSPFLVATCLAAAAYTRGMARLWTVGLPSREFYNVDPDTRYQSISSGCIVTGGEWVFQGPNNLTLLALHRLLGPMPGAYDGPYPDEHDVTHALISAAPLSWSSLRGDSVAVAGRTFRLRPGVGARLADTYESRSDKVCCRPLATVWQNRVLLLQLKSPLDDLGGTAPLLVLIDAATGKVIAYQGHIAVSSHALPEQWT